jgi:transcriptional regulator with GAF, ATPase, and Fis domain
VAGRRGSRGRSDQLETSGCGQTRPTHGRASIAFYASFAQYKRYFAACGFGNEARAIGKAAQANDQAGMRRGGTIFLDEVAELPPDLQAKLLRVLQEGEFEPVGSSQTRKVDVWVIAASNRDLVGAVSEGRFREDLYYRLNVVPIELPPLRECGDDVVTLATAFAARVATRMGRAIEPLSTSDVARLRGYAWPGNIRELQNVIERAIITSVEAGSTWRVSSKRVRSPRPQRPRCHPHRARA